MSYPQKSIVSVILITFCIHISTYAQSDLNVWSNKKTLRIDYVYAGNAEQENIYIKKFNIQPRWSGNPDYCIDTFMRGDQKIEIFDTTGALLFRKSFSSIFKEWRETPEASEIARSITESVTVPCPVNKVEIVFSARNKSLEWIKQISFPFSLTESYYTVHEENPYHYDSILYNGDPSGKVDLVIIPEGYTKQEMAKFRSDARRLTDTLFSWKPFNTMKAEFNVWIVNHPSVQSGTDIPHEGVWKNTAFNSSFNTFGSSRYLMITEIDRLHDAASTVPYDIIYVLVNVEKYGGGAIYNQINLCSSDHESSPFVFCHEFGHGLVGLADEYVDNNLSYQDIYNKDKEPIAPNITTLIDFERKWEDMVSEDTPVPTPETEAYNHTVGAFEGAGYVAQGVYRPVQHCSMRDVLNNSFCPVCCRAIVEIINTYSR